MGEQLCQCLLTFENAWEEKDLDIQTDIQENVLVEADSELLSLVWNNLFSNAVKFTEPGGTLSLTLEAREDLAVVRVGDTGCGNLSGHPEPAQVRHRERGEPVAHRHPRHRRAAVRRVRALKAGRVR